MRDQMTLGTPYHACGECDPYVVQMNPRYSFIMLVVNAILSPRQPHPVHLDCQLEQVVQALALSLCFGHSISPHVSVK